MAGKTFNLNLRDLRKQLATSRTAAVAAVAEGEARVGNDLKQVKKALEDLKKDPKTPKIFDRLRESQLTLEKNQVVLANARRAEVGVTNALRLLEDVCCQQTHNCDPKYH